MPALKADLPDHLYWLTEKVEQLVRPGAFLVHSERHKKTRQPLTPAPQGSTFTNGEADFPVDAPWVANAKSVPSMAGNGWMSHPYDGESFYLQLNLEDIPAEIRPQYPQLPAVGVVWVTIDLSDSDKGWQGFAYWDPRPASEIQWLPRRETASQPTASHFVLRDTLTFATDATLPEISKDYREGGLCGDYDNWRQDHYGGGWRDGNVQVGGWLHPIQGDTDEARKTLLVALEDQGFGDCGAIYLHYSPERGFFVQVWTH